ncbi:TPA: LDL receptor domain-containing protein, partial [Salmonella enterica subsp. enterica serovar Pullorum]|nr:LDL receptor domain-containing protein [Salmonella enterica subsp. enterica serovar Pullorum]
EVGCGAPVDESTASSETEDSTTDVKSLGTQDGSNDIQVAPEVGANKTKELYNCKEHEFHCHDGSCIDWSLLCDSEVHCPDGSDEGEGCFFQKDCGDSLRCGSGSCLPMEWVCDGNFDCPDKSDEKGCKKTLEPEETHENHGILKRLKKDVGVARLLEIQMETAQQEQTNQQHLYQLKVEELSTRNEAAQVELKAAQIWRDVMLERLEQQRKEHSLSLASFQGGKLEQGLNHTATEVPPQSTPAEAV